MQVKFINVFGQCLHPDFTIIKDGDLTRLCVNTPCLEQPFIWVANFENKTINEVADEYNRQIDLMVTNVEVKLNEVIK